NEYAFSFSHHYPREASAIDLGPPFPPFLRQRSYRVSFSQTTTRWRFGPKRHKQMVYNKSFAIIQSFGVQPVAPVEFE
ncbi:MAG TPA: hypothetical protein VIJ01_14890, partial [Candidatus Angelobacter sp.]